MSTHSSLSGDVVQANAVGRLQRVVPGLTGRCVWHEAHKAPISGSARSFSGFIIPKTLGVHHVLADGCEFVHPGLD